MNKLKISTQKIISASCAAISLFVLFLMSYSYYFRV
jgi:hypothetical protein